MITCTTNRWVLRWVPLEISEVQSVLEVKLQLGARHQVVATFFEHLAVESKDANQGLVEVGLNADVVLGRVGAKGAFQRRHSRHVVDHRVGHSDNHIVDVVQGQVDLVSCALEIDLDFRPS